MGNKYKNKPTSSCAYGFSHRSQLEASVCQLIFLREKAGELIHLQHEDHIVICGPQSHACKRKITYIADFKCLDTKTGKEFHIEAKGYANEKWPMKKNLFTHYGPGILEIWGGTASRPVLLEIIHP